MSNISSISGSSLLANYAGYKNTQKTDTTSLADKLFNKLDTKQQGYIDKDELQAALTTASGNASGTSSTSADDLFAKLDTDGDGKITKQEVSDGLTSLVSQFDQMGAKLRAHGGGHGHGHGKDEGLTQDQLTQMAKDSSGTDSARSQFMSNLAENFTAADTDGDGKVTRSEAAAYAKSTGQEMPEPPKGAGGHGGPGAVGGPPPTGAAGGGGDSTADSSSTNSSSATTASTDPADTNGDGKVSAQEALEYLLSQLDKPSGSSSVDSSATTSDTTSTNATSAATASTTFSEKLARQILQLVQTYGNSAVAANDANTVTNVSVSA